MYFSFATFILQISVNNIYIGKTSEKNWFWLVLANPMQFDLDQFLYLRRGYHNIRQYHKKVMCEIERNDLVQQVGVIWEGIDYLKRVAILFSG